MKTNKMKVSISKLEEMATINILDVGNTSFQELFAYCAKMQKSGECKPNAGGTDCSEESAKECPIYRYFKTTERN